jgi:hypothetical protein
MHFMLTLVMGDLIGGILDAIANVLNGVGNFLAGPIDPLLNLTGTTPINLTSDNPLIVTAWQIMLGIADGFLVLFVIGGGVQMMVGQALDSIYIPARAFLPKLFGVALAMHASYLWMRVLIFFNNEMCGVIHASVRDFVLQANGGQPPAGAQEALLAAGLGAFFSLTVVRYIFQSIERIVLLNLLFVLGPIGMMLFFMRQTQPYAAYWSRMYIVTCFLQFVQFLAFGLGFAFLAASGMFAGVTGIIMGTAMMLLVERVPRYFYRLTITAGGTGGGGLAGVARAGIGAAAVFL